MNKDGKWSLDVLYKGFDDPQIEKDFEILSSYCDELNKLAADLSSDNREETIVKALKLNENIDYYIYKLYSFASLVQSTDTTNPDCNKMIERVI